MNIQQSSIPFQENQHNPSEGITDQEEGPPSPGQTNPLSISSQAQEEEEITGDNNNNNNIVIDDDATTQMTEINISSSHNDNNSTNSPYINNQLWTDEEREEYQERRRESLGQELNLVQRTNCIHFSIMCLVPIALIVMVLMNSFHNDGICDGYEIAGCERVERSFMNAFGNKCVCYGFALEAQE